MLGAGLHRLEVGAPQPVMFPAASGSISQKNGPMVLSSSESSSMLSVKTAAAVTATVVATPKTRVVFGSVSMASQ